MRLKFPGRNLVDRLIVQIDEWLDDSTVKNPMAHNIIYQGIWWSFLDAYRWVEGWPKRR